MRSSRFSASPSSLSSRALFRMRSVSISAICHNLLVDRERAAVDLFFGQRPEHLGERHGVPDRVRQDPLGPAALVAGEDLAGAQGTNLHLPRAQNQLDLLAGAGLALRRHGVAPALEGEEPVPGNGALRARDDQVGIGWRAEQRGAIPLGSCAHDLAVGAMPPAPSDLLVPASPGAVCFLVALEGVRPEQPAPDVVYVGLDLPFGLRPVGFAQPYPETVVHRRGQSLRVKELAFQALLAADEPEDHRLRTIVEDLLGHPAEVGEGGAVAPPEG